MSYLTNLPERKSKKSIHIKHSIIEQVEDMVRFFQLTQPQADFDHVIEMLIEKTLSGRSEAVLAYKAWASEEASVSKTPRAPITAFSDEASP